MRTRFDHTLTLAGSGCIDQPGHGRCRLHLVGPGTALQLAAELDCMSCNEYTHYRTSPKDPNGFRKAARAGLPSHGDAVRVAISTVLSTDTVLLDTVTQNRLCG
jgi:hypothetical protein